MAASIAICIACFFLLLFVLRRDSVSLGLPIAYMFSLLLIHVPGAYVYLVSELALLQFPDFVAAGIRLTAIASICFVAGAWTVQLFSTGSRPFAAEIDEWRFSLFCLTSGWLFTYALSAFHKFSSLGAA